MFIHNPSYPGITESWFDPSWWGDRARPVSEGGRGSAWFVDTGQGDVVLRHYRRGGLVARVTERQFLYTGLSRVRSYAEYRLLCWLYEQGLPVPRPVAAMFRKSGLFYSGGIIVERIADSLTFGAIWREADESLWREVGHSIRRFHDRQVCHADLNCFNILVQGNSVYLIDFDKGRVMPSGAKSHWKSANLSRLYRSLVRERDGAADSARLEAGWSCLEAGYRA